MLSRPWSAALYELSCCRICACARCFVNTVRSLELALFCHKYVSAPGKGAYELLCVVCTSRTVEKTMDKDALQREQPFLFTGSTPFYTSGFRGFKNV